MTVKKLLILGGAGAHVKLVEAANSMGIRTYVTDNIASSDAKKIAYRAEDVNIYDIPSLIEFCRKEKIDGALSTHFDPCQRPYAKLCKKLGFHCFGTEEQFFAMTDKHAFKKLCVKNGVDVIPEYTVGQVERGEAEYPLFVKPADSRGSRGQAVCFCKNEIEKALENARRESSNGDVLIEKYLGGRQEIQITYFFADGKPYLIRTADSYTGGKEAGLEKIVACSVSPSRYTDEFLETANARVIGMLESLGIKNGPAFVQGFYDNGKFRFFDPGLRFPGVDYDRIYPLVYGVDLMKLCVSYALDGKIPFDAVPDDMFRLKGKRAAVLFPFIKKGTIASICEKKLITSDKNVFSCLFRRKVGGKVDYTFDVNQRFAEIDLLADTTSDLKNAIKRVQKSLSVKDGEGNEMIFHPFDENRVL